MKCFCYVFPDLSQYHSLSTSIGHFNLFIVGDGLLSVNSSSPQSIFYSSQRHVIVERSSEKLALVSRLIFRQIMSYFLSSVF